MKSELYKTNLTSEPFMYNEMIITSELLSINNDKAKVMEIILKENLFQYKTSKSIYKRLPVIFKRIDNLDNKLIEFLQKADLNSSKIVNLISIYRDQLLLSEFIDYHIHDKIAVNEFDFKKSEISYFIINQYLSHPEVKKWSENTHSKIVQIINKILELSWVLVNKKLGRVMIDRELYAYLDSIWEKRFLESIIC